MNHRSFRDLLLFDIAFAVDRNRALLRRLLKEHVTDDARQQLAKRVVDQLELSDSRSTNRSASCGSGTAGAGGRLLRRLLLEQLQICPRTLQASSPPPAPRWLNPAGRERPMLSHSDQYQ